MTAHYQSMHAAVKMLISRIHALHKLVTQMQAGEGTFKLQGQVCSACAMRLSEQEIRHLLLQLAPPLQGSPAACRQTHSSNCARQSQA